MTVYENMLLLEERVKKAVTYINKLRADNELSSRFKEMFVTASISSFSTLI